MKKLTKTKLQTYTHKMVTFLILNAVAWVWCSYGLAYLGREEIAESLSEKAIINIIAVFFVYGVKALIENISKHTDWPAKNLPDCPEENKENY
jgi:hypothetical protein